MPAIGSQPAPRQGAGSQAAEPDRSDEILAALTDELRSRIGQLERELSTADRAGDAPKLLASLTAPANLVIRQPPAAAQRALALTRDSDIASTALVKLVEEDPSLSHSLLRYANTAQHATSAQSVVSLHSAVQRVGSAGVHNVVLKCMVDGLLCRPGGRYTAMVEDVWSHMVRTAPIARRLAPEFGLVPDHAFALGLLHDVGKLVIFDRIGTLRAQLRRETTCTPELIAKVLRAVHEPLGGIAAVQWKLGEMTAQAIASHHRRPVPTEPHLASELLFIAERLDLAEVRHTAPDLDAWWEEGALLLTSKARVARLLATPA
jgi:HD-like signal output (HDOD) protein